ncbi:hypothetical protein B6D60_09665, partial [candidate division KSB1 bacterium 4484_87]
MIILLVYYFSLSEFRQSYRTSFNLVSESILNFLLVIFIILHGYFAVRRHARENLWVSLGAVLLLLVNNLRLFYQPAINSPEETFRFHSLSFALAIFLFAICWSISSFARGKFIEVNDRKKKYFWFLLTSLIVMAISVELFFYGVVPFHSFQIQSFALHQILSALGILIMSFLIVRFSLLYAKKDKTYFLNEVVASFILASSFLLIFLMGTKEHTLVAARLETISAFLVMTWALFLENHLYLEEERELRYRVEQDYAEKENQLHHWQRRVELEGVGLCELSENGELEFVNEAMALWLKSNPRKLSGKNLSDFLTDESRADFKTEILNCREKNRQIDLKLKSGNGKTIPVKCIGNRFERGWRLVVFENKSEVIQREQLRDYATKLESEVQKRTRDLESRQQELEKVERFYETLLGAMTDIMMVVNRKGNCTYINPYGKRLLGYEAKQLNGRKLPNFFDDVNKLQRNYGDSVQVELRDHEAAVKAKGGKKILVSWNVRYLFDENGKNIGAMCIGREVDEKKALQKKLQQQQDALQTELATRTQTFQDYIRQLHEILSLDENLLQANSAEKFLTETCQSIRRLGWQRVIFSLKVRDSSQFKISAYAGVAKNQIREFVRRRPFLYQGAEIYF